MSSLQNLQINDTFPGLIKTNNEAAVDGTLRTLQDGAGNNLPMQVSTTGVNFTGTVTGIPVGGVQSILEGTNITVDATDPFNPIVSATGGGGGSPTKVGFYNTTIATPNIGSVTAYRFNFPLAGGVLSPNTCVAGSVYLSPVTFLEGDIISGFQFRIQTASVGATVDVGIYTSEIVGGRLSPATLIDTIATGINAGGAGAKNIDGLSITLPASANNLYWVGFLGLGGNPIYAKPNIPMSMIGNLTNASPDKLSMYRTSSFANTSLPTSLSGVSITAGVNDSIIFGTY